MNETLIDNHNQSVKPFDEIYLLGDFYMGQRSYFPQFIKLLNGRKHLILGNHDKLSKEVYLNNGFETVSHYKELNINNKLFVLCHYPLLSWRGKNRKSIHLYGHTHKPLPDFLNNIMKNSYNVAVNLNEYKPIHIDAIRTYGINL